MKKLALVFFLFTTSYSPENCTLKRDEDGVKVYTCKNEGEKLKSLKAEFTLKNITIDELETMLLNVEKYTTWQYNMVEAELLKKINDHEMIYRTVVDAPWPVDNRELVVKYTSQRDRVNQTMDIVIESVDYDVPINEDFVRIPESYATWHVITQDASLKVEYALRVDPGGSVPAWLVNMAMADGPHHSFRNLKKLMEK